MKSRTRWLMLAAVAALGATQVALAQPLLCTAIRPGETATDVARRITGEARSARESWFQIVDPTASRFVSKAQYDYVRPGWSACVATGFTGAAASPASSTPALWVPRIRFAYEGVLRLIQSADSNIALWLVLLALIAVTTHGADLYLRDRQRVLDAMQQFSQKFIQEFERPLTARDLSARPIQSRLRFAPHAARLDIFIAPGAGHCYPNLTDHRNNVEYDLKRVLNILRDQPFVNGRPYTDGPWVVLPFLFQPGITQAGGK